MVVIQDSFDPAVPLTHSRIGIDSIARSGTVSASSAQQDFPAIAARNPLTYESWKPVSMPAWWRVDAGAVVTCDYVGIAAHTLGSSSCTVFVEVSEDNNTWTEVMRHEAVDNRPIMLLFAPQASRYWRVRITGTVPSVGVINIGRVLEMQRASYAGLSPIELSRSTLIRPTISEGGLWLGRSIIRQGNVSAVSFRHLTYDWYRANFDPFVEKARRLPFFFAWRPEGYPESIGYVWTVGDIAPTTMGIKSFLQVGFEMEGISLD